VCSLLSPSPLLALLYDFAQIHNRPYLTLLAYLDAALESARMADD
jgi:hypothetical protein